jgi:hypothetical protein
MLILAGKKNYISVTYVHCDITAVTFSFSVATSHLSSPLLLWVSLVALLHHTWTLHTASKPAITLKQNTLSLFPPAVLLNSITAVSCHLELWQLQNHYDNGRFTYFSKYREQEEGRWVVEGFEGEERATGIRSALQHMKICKFRWGSFV